MADPILPQWTPPTLEAPSDGDLTWAYPWPGGDRLAVDLPQVVDAEGLTVGELGCGRGRCGLTLLAAGARRLVAGDCSTLALGYVDQALAANGWSDRGMTVEHHWGSLLPGGPFDLLVGADVLYRPAFHPALLDSIAASIGEHGIALLSDPRRQLEDHLPRLAAEREVSWIHLHRPGPYSLVVLSRHHPPPWFRLRDQLPLGIS